MNRDEYMRCKGELQVAVEEEAAAAVALGDLRKQLQGFVNGLAIGQPATPEQCQRAKATIDSYLALQGQHLAAQQRVAQFGLLLKPFPRPPAE